MKRILIILIVLGVIAAAGAYFYFSKALAPGDVPLTVTRAEDAVATSGTIAIASVDMRYVRRIEEVAYGEKDPSPLVDDKAKPEKTLFEKLNKQGVDLYSETDYAFSTINTSQGKAAYTFVLFGRFSVDNLKQAVRKYYQVKENTAGYWVIEALPQQAKKDDPCAAQTSSAKKPAPVIQALHIQKDRIIYSSPELMPILLKRFAENSQSEVSLEKWRQFRSDKVVAAAFMSPKEAKKGAVDFPSAILLGAVSEQPLQDIYAGARVSLLPAPGLSILLDLHANEAAWPRDIKSKFDEWQHETLSALKEMPTLGALIQSLHVQAEGNILRMNTTADRTTVANLEKVPGEFFSMIFSQASFGNQKKETVAAEEIVKDEDIEKYLAQFEFTSVKPFTTKDAFHVPDVVTGPFSVRLKRIGLLQTDDSIIELKISTEGTGFENLSSEQMHQSSGSPVAGLSISSVEDKEGNNLLREEQCGKTRNLAVKKLTVMRDKEYIDGQWRAKSIKVYGEKSIRLKPNIPLSQVAKIEGKIAIRAATRTRVQTLKKPLAGKTVETGKVRMYLKTSNPNTVKYQLSGDMTHILDVRAKNAKGQYLKDTGSSGSGDENTKTIATRFKGKVASIEVVVAEKLETQDYPFLIDNISLRYGERNTLKQLGVTRMSKKAFLKQFTKVEYKEACKGRQMVKPGSFLVCLGKFGERWGREVGGEFDVYAPAADALQKNLAAATLSIDSVQTDTGEEIAVDKSERLDFDYQYDSRYNKEKKDFEKFNERLRASYVRLYSDNKALKDKKINRVKGTLTIRFPKKPEFFELGADELGVIKKSNNGLIANIAAFEDWSTYIDLQGPVEKVMRFMALAKDGTILKTGNDRINEKQYQTWGLSKEEKEKISYLPKKWQGMITIYGKPEVIRVYYSDDFEVIQHNFEFAIK